MMVILAWVTVGILWLIAAAFAVSDILCLLGVIHHFRKDPELAAVYVVVVIIFAVFSVGAAWSALAVGRGLF